jgi:large subunit ribosomal protein L24
MMYTPPKKKGPRTNKPIFQGKIRLRVGDVVRVIAGKDAGKEGTVSRILPTDGKVVVEGVNIVIKHQKARPQANANAAAQQSGRIEMAAPMHICKVQLVDKGGDKGVTRIGIKTDANGNRVRYAKKSGGVIE